MLQAADWKRPAVHEIADGHPDATIIGDVTLGVDTSI
jgi:carbonic anhydrase/acetyltransferase-like protein (isoleucine patch superfamily)